MSVMMGFMLHVRASAEINKRKLILSPRLVAICAVSNAFEVTR